MAVDTKVETLIINRLSRNKYEQLKSSGALKDDELYITPMITKISELENDVPYITTSNTYTKPEIDAMIGDINTILEEINGN